jgi:hypothetical protein
MKSCYFVFNRSVLLCPNLYSVNPHNSRRTRYILVLVHSTAETIWTLSRDGFVSLTHGFSTMTDRRVKVTLRLTVSQSVTLGAESHLGLMTRYLAITIWQLRSCFYGDPSLTRGRVCLLYMLLGLPKAVFLVFESLGTRDHILLSQMWDFPFRRLLRLAGSRRRYSTLPLHGSTLTDRKRPLLSPINFRHGPHRKHLLL